LPATLLAQSSGANSAYSDAPSRGTVFGGYSYLRNNSNGFNGFEGQGTFNFSRYIGVTADLGGNYRTLASGSILGVSASANQRLYTFMFGPTVTAPIGRSSVFAHALFGEAHSSLGAGVSIPIIGGISTGVTSANAFAMAFGGGVDIGLSKHVAIRAAQVDFIRTQFNSTDALATGLSSDLGDHQNSMRYSGGIVFRF
jgi:peptidoglycan-associated lipoprotein